jgi:hypothetical protein
MPNLSNTELADRSWVVGVAYTKLLALLKELTEAQQPEVLAPAARLLHKLGGVQVLQRLWQTQGQQALLLMTYSAVSTRIEGGVIEPDKVQEILDVVKCLLERLGID